MSLDRSLKSASSLVRHRNVLTRAERIDRLKSEDKWTDTRPVYGLPKVANRKAAVVKSVKEEVVDGAVPAVAGAAPAAGAKGAAGAKAPAGAKAAAPAAGAKGAAAAPAKGAAGAKAAAPAAGAKKK